MKLSIFLGAVAAITASALPAPAPAAINELGIDLTKREDPTTRNDLSGPCKAVTVIFARGTIELGNVGLFAGPPFFDALEADLAASNVAVQGVDYGATIAGYLAGGDPAGAATLASLTNEAASKCPSTQIVLSGYRFVAHILVTASRS